MLTLYFKPTCPFCRRVLAEIDRLELEVEMKDITSEDSFNTELEEKGGKHQVPFLIDTDNDTSLYESDAIVAHLQKHYGTTSDAPARPRIHVSDSACVSCEG